MCKLWTNEHDIENEGKKQFVYYMYNVYEMLQSL